MDGAGMLADAGVSQREEQVLDMLGEHLTHAQIGSRLFISVRTVESHVADAALHAGDTAAAAVAFARGAELLTRFRGMFPTLPPPGTVEALLGAARSHAAGELRAEAAIATAEANGVDVTDPRAADIVELAIEQAHQTGDPLLESAALDALLSVQVMRGDVVDAAATGRHRVELLRPLALEPETALGLKDALHSAVFTSLGAGDLPGARVLAEWYLALRSEAAVLAGRPHARELIATADVASAGNPVATALVRRADALLTGNRAALVDTADRFADAGCHYQLARTLVLAGGEEATAGSAALAALGAAAMVT